ncbi:metal ABC transporter solute-binding protein, Zn/Mn family [Desulfuribacillus alkaliarsenatis]|uniref:ABC transporter substrate-binding protein n=1 Tax=Desulfuribacillus alkaliarsenatis TaxID=766136 RepID=A0A1E5G1M9_9FIRM|nr:zinc ABC transporter substrate-binding protein [Desulfuribacillus alkaliarsenatis]OEF96732.1 hypothetical protein BHF68_06575 [Desulfuribacillus alkaliarsenatis]
MKQYQKDKCYNRVFIVFMLLLLIISTTGCSNNVATIDATAYAEESINEAKAAGKLIVFTSTYPLYEFTKRIGGDEVAVYSIMPPGADAHDYEPSTRQMMGIANADLFVYNGAGFELWIDKLLQALEGDHDLHIINSTEGLPLVEAEHDSCCGVRSWYVSAWYWFLGLFGIEGHGHSHGAYDPHVWLDPTLASMQAEQIYQGLKEVKPESAELFAANFHEIKAELIELDSVLSEELADVTSRTFVVSHAGYGYLANRYNLEQIPITGIHPGSEPSSRELRGIIDFLRESDNKYVFFETTVSNKTAQVIAEEVGARVLILHPIENLTQQDIDAGETYFSLMYQNLENLLIALQ